ncbi:MAG: hypothetical protein M1281_10560 [Chloroflexi bacterium]|nr:hypothetical protein [Chloroflexota bacterium]
MTRILFLLTQDLESPSGSGRYLPLARELRRLGHLVWIAALHPDFDALPQRQLEIDGVQVRYVAPMHVQKRGSQKSYYSPGKLLAVSAQAAWQLSRAALQIPVDVVYVGKPHPMNSLAGLAAHFLAGRKVYLDCDDYEARSNRFAAGWQRWGGGALRAAPASFSPQGDHQHARHARSANRRWGSS